MRVKIQAQVALMGQYSVKYLVKKNSREQIMWLTGDRGGHPVYGRSCIPLLHQGISRAILSLSLRIS